LFYICKIDLFIMFKKQIAQLFIFIFIYVNAQNNQVWQGYFSYNQVTAISQSNEAFYAATENAIFSKNLNTNNLSTINSVDGLKAETISALYYSETSQKTFIGNNNGLLLIKNQEGNFLTKNGIVEELPVSPFIKKINHFTEFQNNVYLACDYGISTFNQTTNEFGDTFYIGNGGSTVKVYQTAILNNELYAFTDSQGIKKASISNPNLVDYNQWQVFDGGYWLGGCSFNNVLIACNANGKLYRFNGGTFVEIGTLQDPLQDLRTFGDYLIATTTNHVYIFNNAFQQIGHVISNQFTNASVTFTCATVINNTIFIGTNENGVLSSSLSNPSNFEVNLPNGPFMNSVFRVKKSTNALWAVYGKYSRTYNPYVDFGPGKYPISKFTETNGWKLIPYSSLFGARSLSSIAVHPTKVNEIYISSYFSGLLKIVNDVPTILYNHTNTGANGLESLGTDPNYIDIRINGPVYDSNGNLWMTNNFVQKGIKLLKADGAWASYDVSQAIPNPLAESYAVPVIDKNNSKWLPTSTSGIAIFNETISKSMLITDNTSGNLPSLDVRCIAIDSRNQAWIGTSKGLRIISSVDQFVSQDEIETKPIIILEDGLAQELFYEQFILDIAVDGANRKWVSTADAGVFLVSSNGQETIHHFTKENSSLPSDNIIDIEIDGVTGEVFFATDKGLVSFKGSATKPSESLDNVYAYPNPVRPNFTGTVKIAGLTSKATVKITDIEGNLVHETTSDGGTIEWDTTAFGKYKVASGVYLIMVSSQDGLDTTVKKVMIIR
jgi:ligand-binding sensor domain-containing protein